MPSRTRRLRALAICVAAALAALAAGAGLTIYAVTPHWPIITPRGDGASHVAGDAQSTPTALTFTAATQSLDANNDGQINATDLGALIGAWRPVVR